MAGATRQGLPRCEEMVVKYEKRTPVGVEVCGKPAIAKYFWRAVSDVPKHVCVHHDAEIMRAELKDDLEREFNDRTQDNL